jgi:hypothetical protein
MHISSRWAARGAGGRRRGRRRRRRRRRRGRRRAAAARQPPHLACSACNIVTMSFHHALLAVLAAAFTATGYGRTLQYFGWYDNVQSVDLPVTGSSSNLVQAGSVAEAVMAKAAGQSSLLMVESLFPGLKSASPDFKSKWIPAVPELRSLLVNKTIVGFGLGDELVWGGVTPAHYTQYANTVRASFPRSSGAVIWSNEACFFHGPRQSWRNAKHEDVSNYSIPAALDWFSIDQCACACSPCPPSPAHSFF